MKKKIIIAVLVITILGIAAGLGWKLYDSKQEVEYNSKQEAECDLSQEPVEEPFEIDPIEMYGELDYLGPMERKVEPLTEEEIKELNPDGLPCIGYDEQIDCTEIYGRFNTTKIESVYDAREAVCRALEYAGYACDEKTLMYGCESLLSQDVYTYDYFYKGVKCQGRHVGIWVDEAGNSEQIWISGKLEKKVELESVVPVYRGEKLQTLLDERYGKCEIRHKWLNICWYGEEYGLEWCIEFDAENSPIHMIWMNANTGEIGAEDPMDPVY